MLLQFLPKAPERARQADLHPGDAPEGTVAHSVAEDDAWVEGQSLIGTVEDVELIDPDLSGERLLYRLFHERGVRVFAPLPLRAQCSCSRDAVSSMLKSFAPQDRAEMVKDGKVVVTCEFCSSVYRIHAAGSRRGVVVARLAPQTRSSSPAHAGAPVFQRRQRLSGRAAAYWMPACAGKTTYIDAQVQFNTRLPSGLSSENVGTSISKCSPLSLTIW